MSRCFPFPPPGYEKKPKNGQLDLLTKEKLKEKKHKKEKKDKDKRVSKEKKDKDRSKDKHRDKKDRKEKHKDKKKDKDRDKDKNKVPDGARIEERTRLHSEEKSGDVLRKTTEIKDSKFAEELGRRIRDEEKAAATRMVDNAAGSAQKRMESVSIGAAVTNSNQKSNENMAIETSLTTSTARRNESQANAIAVTSSGQKRSESMGSAAGITLSVQRRNDSTGTATGGPGSFPKRSDSVVIAAASEKEKYAGGRMVPNDVFTDQRRNSQICRPSEKDMEKKFPKKTESMGVATGLPGLVPKRMEGMDPTLAIEKERFTENKVVQDFNSADRRRNDEVARSLEKDGDFKRVEAEQKAKDREAGHGTGDGHKDRDREEKKNKGKDKDRHKKDKDKEKTREKGERKHKENDKVKDSAANDHIDNQNLKPLASHKESEKIICSDGNIKKRKDIEVNGFLHEDDARPNKFPRPVSSSCLPAENGRLLEPYPTPTPNSSVRHGPTNKMKAHIALDNKDYKTNGLRKAQPSSADLGASAAVKRTANGEPSSKPPHPDSKYLSQIYSIPQMEELPEYDDQEWLLSSKNHQQELKGKLEAEGPPQVWGNTVWIETADVLALPYVIPY